MSTGRHRAKLALKRLLFRGGRKPRRVRFGPGRGVRLALDRRTGLQVELGLYESELHRIYRTHVPPGGLVWDVGASDGATVLLFANLGARVVAWEPRPEALALLDENLALNAALRPSVEIVPAAFAPPRAGAVPDFVKVDVEGAELEVLAGVPEAATAIVVETHSSGLERACTELLRDRGYATRVIPNARWRRLYPEYRPLAHNRWLLALRRG